MDLESTIETIASYIPSDVENAIAKAASYLPEELDVKGALSAALDAIPAEIDFVTTMQFLLYFAAGSLLLGVLSRVVLGKRSSLNHSLSSVMGILLIYVVTIVVDTFKPWNLDKFLSPLPFVTFIKDYIVFLSFRASSFPAICHEILAMVILAFLVNLIDTFMPKGKSVVGWYLLRFLSIILAMVLHLVVSWAFNTYLPDVLVTYAPVILLVILVAMLLLGVMNLLLGVVLTVVNPIIGAVYTFFFSNAIGKQLTKAVFTTAILCILVYLMDYFGYLVICTSASALLSYIPLMAVLLVLWYLIGHVL